MSWWPALTLGSLYALRLLQMRASMAGLEAAARDGIELDSLGVTVHESRRRFLAWADVTQVDVQTRQSARPSESLCFVLTAQPQEGEIRSMVIEGRHAASAQLIKAMGRHLGGLDSGQLLKSFGAKEDGCFTVWRREPVAP